MTAQPDVTADRIRDRADEIVVALPHLAAVRAGLRALGVDAQEIDRDELLGLALLRLDRDPTSPESTAQLPVPELLARLCQASAKDHGGWVPTVGRNRVLDHVAGAAMNPAGEVIYGGKVQPVGART